MDSIILFGNDDPQLVKLLDKMGYQTQAHNDPTKLDEIARSNHPDLLVIDSRHEFDALELLNFFREQENTKQVPIIFLAKDKTMQRAVAELKTDRVEIVPLPYRIGTLVSKIATQLRLRKFNGADEEHASLGEINARLRELNACFTKQLTEARELQMSLVPKQLPKDERYSMAIVYQPLEEVGGDWYYVQQESDGCIRVHVADVTGHGLSAAFIACITKLAMHASGNSEPKDQLTSMNRYMSTCIPGSKFVTMLSYLYNPDTGSLKVVCAGHPPALILQRKDNQVRQIKNTGFAIGFFEESEYQQEEAILQPGDCALILTDALPEAQNMSGNVYGYDQMEKILLNSGKDLKATQILQNVLEDFDQFRDGRILKDDLTVIVLKREK